MEVAFQACLKLPTFPVDADDTYAYGTFHSKGTKSSPGV